MELLKNKVELLEKKLTAEEAKVTIAVRKQKYAESEKAKTLKDAATKEELLLD